MRSHSTLAEARQWLADNIIKGIQCPCCEQKVKLYRRQINSGMARSLIAIYLHGPAGEWVHVPTSVGARSREEGKLRYWGLVEERMEVARADGGRAGYWRITDAGRAWVTGQSTVPKYVTVYNNTVYAIYGPPVGVADALGTSFDYTDLMRPSPTREIPA